MLFNTLASTAAVMAIFVGSTVALPPGKPGPVKKYTPAKDLGKLAKIMPLNGLPAPDGELKYVVLGLGTQNYTCVTDNENDAPGTTGATATLYDIGTALKDDPLAQWKINSLSALALSLSTWTARLGMNLESQGFANVVGHHFFNRVQGTNTPIFAFDQLDAPYPMAQVLKQNATDAPPSSCPGLKGEGSVPWLLLKDTRGISQGGIDTVYRIETAGGKAPATCVGQKQSFEVAYAAQYWVYGPRK